MSLLISKNSVPKITRNGRTYTYEVSIANRSVGGSTSGNPSMAPGDYYTISESDAKFVDVGGDFMTGSLMMTGSVIFNNTGTNGIYFTDLDTGFYEIAGGYITFKSNGITTTGYYNNWMWGGSGTNWLLIDQQASSTTPNIFPDSGDPNTGIGHAASDQLSIIAGGVESFRGTTGGLKADTIESKNTSFSTGFLVGDGYQLKDESGVTTFELDNLIIRNSMYANELVLNKIRATNGNLWVTDSVKATGGLTYDASIGYWYMTFESSSGGLTHYDVIKTQAFDGNNIYSHVVYVAPTGSANDRYYIRGRGHNPFTQATPGYRDHIKLNDTSGDWYTFNSTQGGYNIRVTPGHTSTATSSNIDLSDKTGSMYVSASWTNTGTNLNNAITISLKNEAGTNIGSSLIANPQDNSIAGNIKLDGNQNTGSYIQLSVSCPPQPVTSSVTNFGIHVNDYTHESFDATNKDFVRIGNQVSASRQGSIYLATNDTTAPFIDVLNEITGSDIQTRHRKVRLGKLDGILYNSGSLSGYGLYSENSYLTGNLVSTDGTGTQRIEINASDNNLTLWTADTDEHPRIYIDSDIYDTGQVGILLDGPTNKLGWFVPGRIGVDGGTGGGGSVDIDCLDSGSGDLRVKMTGLPTSTSGLTAGTIWSDGGTLKIV